MMPLLKKYWWLVLLVTIVFILKFYPDKLPFLEKIDRSKKESFFSNTNAYEQHYELRSDNWFYAPVATVKYKAESRAEIMTDGDALDPRVAPDGTRIVFVLKTKDYVKLALADLVSNKVTPLDIELKDVANPAWDTEGTKITFSGITGTSIEIFTYEIESKKLLQVTHDTSRKKSWPRFSPYMFGEKYRIAYSSEGAGRKDIWWVRDNGDNDMPITFSADAMKKYKNDPPKEWAEGAPQELPSLGGEFPEWSPSGFEILYKSDKNTYNKLLYSYGSWWRSSSLYSMQTTGILGWAPNEMSRIEYNPEENTATRIPLNTGSKTTILQGKKISSMPAYFPDGKALAYTQLIKGKSILSIEPLDDPLGDVANLWMYSYNGIQKDKITRNQLLLLHSNNDQMYKIYESEFYHCNEPDEFDHARPYLVTSDAVMETFYAAFTALLGYSERVEFVSALTDFANNGYEISKVKKADKEIQNFFLTGLALINPNAVKDVPAPVNEEILKIKSASGLGRSSFGQKISYDEFLIRGKYERDKDLQQYFQALKWFQVFKFDLHEEKDRKWVTALLEILREPSVLKPLEKISQRLRTNLGESRYYGPMNLNKLANDGMLPEIKAESPWLTMQDSFKIFPSIYTLDAYVFDELITHTDRANTVGTADNARVLPVGMDIMASFGSTEARKILVEEMNENRFDNYEKKLAQVTEKVSSFPSSIWDADLYHAWLGMLNALVSIAPHNAPDFTKTPAWKRKELNTALGSWVNLRYETAAYVEHVAAECGEGGYEQVMVGMPKGYVEPNPEFFKRLNSGFGKIRQHFKEVVAEKELQRQIDERIAKFQEHLIVLEKIAQKEITNEPRTDEEYSEILYVGRLIEHFILIMNSISSDHDKARNLSNPDSIKKIVHVQTSPFGEKLYEGIGPANEINVIVPFFGRRQIVKGPVYSYYEFRSSEVWKNDRWRKDFDMRKGLPAWIKDYYEGMESSELHK